MRESYDKIGRGAVVSGELGSSVWWGFGGWWRAEEIMVVAELFV